MPRAKRVEAQWRAQTSAATLRGRAALSGAAVVAAAGAAAVTKMLHAGWYESHSAPFGSVRARHGDAARHAATHAALAVAQVVAMSAGAGGTSEPAGVSKIEQDAYPMHSATGAVVQVDAGRHAVMHSALAVLQVSAISFGAASIAATEHTRRESVHMGLICVET